VLLQASWGDGVDPWGYQREALSDAFHSYRLGRSGSRPSISRAGIVPVADYADCLSGFLRASDLAHPYVAGLSFGAVWGYHTLSALQQH
jgi:hypothetical protein